MLDDQINIVLVAKDIRKVCLLEVEKIEELMSFLAKYPELKVSHTKFGILVSKQQLTDSDVPDDESLGRLLGFPCADQFDESVRRMHTHIRYSLSLYAQFKDGRVEQFFANVCLDPSEAIHEMEKLAEQSEVALKEDSFFAPILERVFMNVRTHTPAMLLINMLVVNDNISEDALANISNLLANLGFPTLRSHHFKISNPVHRGILITLLTNFMNNPVEVFYPLQKRAIKAVQDKMKGWENQLFEVLAVKGGKRQPKTRRGRK
jgi:hypothetical protein